ncbi:MAG: C40 family peptidase [Rhodobacteraceae bacterium]|jgi:cell wall-associated NlpC family hydrolase|nr:C40 family peptidase [Paracoccaceae bacterium]
MDRRLTPFSGRIAHVSLAENLPGVTVTPGEPARIAAALVDLCAAPAGARDRQLLHGAEVTVIDRQSGHAFVMAAADGYCGWLPEGALAAPDPATHRVATRGTHLYSGPKVQAGPLLPLPLNARLHVTGRAGSWAETAEGFVPAAHLAPLDEPAEDPVAVAELLLGAPYVWGGNSAQGVDCSGLVQLAFHAAGRTMPGDSDLQRSTGTEIPAGTEQRGDLIFWRGHVALVARPGRILHANGHTMSVAYEDLAEAIARIAAQDGAPVLARRRP